MKRFTELRGIALAALMLATVTLSAEDGALRGKFTVNADGDQVVFSQGNLQYQAVSETGGASGSLPKSRPLSSTRVPTSLSRREIRDGLTSSDGERETTLPMQARIMPTTQDSLNGEITRLLTVVTCLTGGGL
ncbi:MAG: hypothetical protein K5660_00675 [Paludibacteraceae bacterium]|nr:hypothetical protein [Paludibacteraceae bacterium]